MDDGSEVESHRYFEEMAVAHVLGGLDESEGRAFRTHLLGCAHCRARVGELRAIAHDLADAERDERRVRAAQALETKRRESEDEDDDLSIEVVRSRRASWIILLSGLMIFLALSAWNVTLRSGIRDLARQNELLLQATMVMQLGAPQIIDDAAPGVTAAVRLHQGMIGIALDGLPPMSQYGVYLQTEDGTVRWANRFPSDAEGHLLTAVDTYPDVRRVVVGKLPANARLVPEAPSEGLNILTAQVSSG
ncbi:MAG TPA: zf-HC2 domain-containing protein [Egibacteraceae bacterium]|nr:zf-HC2 domain-containing protein [Egibacteraceae bacterium]